MEAIAGHFERKELERRVKGLTEAEKIT